MLLDETFGDSRATMTQKGLRSAAQIIHVDMWNRLLQVHQQSNAFLFQVSLGDMKTGGEYGGCA
jgi:hypothetical protein